MKRPCKWSVFAVTGSVGLVICILLLVWVTGMRGKEEIPNIVEPSPQDTVEVPTVTPVTPEAKPVVEVPVDFEEWQARNEDIYAWIQLPGTVVDYPVLQRFGDEGYYLRRDVDGANAIAGSLFTEYCYNGVTFQDPVTVIYGHDMKNGSMFGSLQTYFSPLTLDESSVFFIYQPDRKMTYQVFAAVPYNNRHLLYGRNFWDKNTYQSFFEEISEIRSLQANMNAEAFPEFGDRVVILSTCLKGDNTRRYLVMGVLIEGTAS